MRGSPLLRFILLAFALAATAAGLARVTSSRQSGGTVSHVSPKEKPATKTDNVPFRLLLSDPASEVIIDAAAPLRLTASDSAISGGIVLDSRNPSLGLIVRWKSPTTPGEHRFAKLTLEAPGQPTFTHVFDADGDIDDFLELPFPVSK
ncbi:MAG: hypothetical protein EOP88_26620 [Verrucomicrobiaceae bacterium]|nr:MAG: hypothetical protein EOP88_26620 [Verrucomicrobiaceae bacterium]